MEKLAPYYRVIWMTIIFLLGLRFVDVFLVSPEPHISDLLPDCIRRYIKRRMGTYSSKQQDKNGKTYCGRCRYIKWGYSSDVDSSGFGWYPFCKAEVFDRTEITEDPITGLKIKKDCYKSSEDLANVEDDPFKRSIRPVRILNDKNNCKYYRKAWWRIKVFKVKDESYCPTPGMYGN